MYIVFNYLFLFFMSISIAVVYEGNAPSWLILLLLLTAECFQVSASSLLEKKYDNLESRIKKLENKKEGKDDGKTN